MNKVGVAASRCEDLLPSALAERRKVKTSSLPLYKEVGAIVFQMIKEAGS